MQLEETINDKKKTGRTNFWTPARKNQLKRLTNNRKGVSQIRYFTNQVFYQIKYGRKLGVSHVTICEKTPKYTEKQVEKAKNLCNLLYRS